MFLDWDDAVFYSTFSLDNDSVSLTSECESASVQEAVTGCNTHDGLYLNVACSPRESHIFVMGTIATGLVVIPHDGLVDTHCSRFKKACRSSATHLIWLTSMMIHAC